MARVDDRTVTALFPAPPPVPRLATDVATLFGDLARARPDAEAVLAPGRHAMTFAALADHIHGIAGHLAARGLGRGDRIAVVLPNGPEAAVAFVATVGTAIHCGLNPAYTADELRRYLALVRPRAMIVARDGSGAAASVAAELGVPVLALAPEPDGPAGAFGLEGPSVAAPRAIAWNAPDDVALILHTSGTTEAQKLVPRTLAATLSRVNVVHYGLGPGERGLLLMPMFHGLGLMATVGPALTSGGSVICPTGFEAAGFPALLREFRPTWLMAVPPILRAILDHAGAIRAGAPDARLRFVRTGAGRLDPAVLHGIEDLFRTAVLDSYGLSEVGPVASSPPPPRPRKLGTVGVPMGSTVAIVDPDGRPLAPLEDGEIVVRGDDVFAGYLDDPAATAAVIRDGWFHTGDLGHFDADGHLVVRGRLKEMINRGGEKIAPTEVESALVRHPAVHEAAAFALPHPTLGEEVAAAVVLRPGHRATEAEILAAAREHLAPFKLPRRIMIRAALPRGSSEKIRRAELAALCRAEIEAADAAAGARTPSAMEAALAALWCDVLERRTVPLDRNFFLLGGDSLKAASLLVRVEAVFGVALEVGRMFEDLSTIEAMAAVVAAARGR